jgi:hypothetical protein
MNRYSAILLAFLLLTSIAILFFSDGRDIVAARQFATTDEILPHGGGKHDIEPRDEMSDEERERIQAGIRTNIERLEREGRLPAARPEAVPLAWPLRKAAGVTDFHVDGISNYVDHNPAVPNLVLDWNCGSRTYDQSSGYNHAGIDMFISPFPWKKVDDNAVEIIAAAPGTIVDKRDGNFDRNCSLNGTQWNAVYIRHADNSIAWYGHMKNGSLTSKGIGDTVVTGEKIGIVGSSGNSTGPHLHFELRNNLNQLQDPFQGPCNTMNPTGWWVEQEPYRVSRINALMTQSAAPVSPACPTTEITNQKSIFQAGEQIVTAAYFRDQINGEQVQYSLLQPDGTAFQAWTQTFTSTFNSSRWWWFWTIPTNPLNGTWKLRAVYNSVTYETPFIVGQASPFATVSGRVTTPSGLGLRNAVVSIIDSASVRRTATTSSFGLYSFDGVPTAGIYTITVASKRYRFSARSMQIDGNLTGIDFVGLE